MINIEARLDAVRARIERAAQRNGRKVADIELVAVTKTHPAAVAQSAVDAGARALGENRVQEAAGKIAAVRGEVRWHLIGGLQSNKARKAASLFDVVHSVDGPKLARRLDRAAGDLGRRLDAYVQVEFVRAGLSVAEIEQQANATVAAVAESENLRLIGLMTLPPYDPDVEVARGWFRKLRALRDRIAATGPPLPGLSMGMSADFEVAIQEGATAVRVGTTIFGARD